MRALCKFPVSPRPPGGVRWATLWGKEPHKKIKHPLQTKPFSDDGDLQYLLTQASPTPPTPLVLSLPPVRCCSFSLLSFGAQGALINGLTSCCGLSLEWPAVVTLSHRHTCMHIYGNGGLGLRLWSVWLGIGFGDGWQSECVTQGGGGFRGGGDEGSEGQEFVPEPVLFHTAAGWQQYLKVGVWWDTEVMVQFIPWFRSHTSVWI